VLHIEVTPRPGYLALLVVSDDLTAHTRQLTAAITEAVASERPTRLLIDLRGAHGRLSPGALFLHVGSVPLTAAATATRTAVLERREHAEHAAFAEDALFNRGFTNVRYFTVEAAARAWLLESPGGDGADEGAAITEGADAL
jgi:hypothetical protein